MKRIKAFLLVATASVVAPACDPGVDDGGGGGGDGGSGGSGGGSADEWEARLNERKPDYSAALRIAALRLIGELPTATQIAQVADAPDDAAKKAAYETLIDSFLASPLFARQMVLTYKDQFKMGGTMGTVDLDSAPVFAAQLAVTNGDFRQLLTATTGTCPTFTAATNTFTAANCNNGVTTHSGVLTNPGVMAQFNSNFAFRRVRWIEETFNCLKFPAALREVPETQGGKLYTGEFPWLSISGKDNGGGRVDFLDTSSVVCANCHNNINHRAPLFANFNATGQLTGAIAVLTPLGATDLARATDYLPPGEPTAYRLGQLTPTIPAMGAAMAADPEVAACAVKRAWNWAFGAPDIVNELALIPDAVIKTDIDAFAANGFKTRDMIRSIFVSDHFTKF